MSSIKVWMEDLRRDVSQELHRLPCAAVFVGFSGGVDSTVLLYLACDALGASNVTAVHVDHGLSSHSARWVEHCQAVVKALGCHLVVKHGLVKETGQGVEAAARDFRYQQFSDLLPKGGVLLLGHHLDDQVETFFLRLMRGSGLHGLQSMHRSVDRSHYKIVRPLLDLSRSQIESYANALNLTWIEDESNQQIHFDRNYLRHEVLPLLEVRWPSYRERVQSVVHKIVQSHTSTNVDIAQELENRLSFDGALKLVKMDGFTSEQQLSLLHAWLTSIGQLVPSKTRLDALLTNIVLAKPDSMPEVSIGDGYVRRHGPALYWVPKMVDPEAPPLVSFDEEIYWPGVGSIRLDAISEGESLLLAGLPNLNWRLRQGGEKMRPVGRSKTRDLKRLLQEYRVKPWLRHRIPLLFSGDELVAAGDLLISGDHIAPSGSPGIRVIWRNNEILH